MTTTTSLRKETAPKNLKPRQFNTMRLDAELVVTFYTAKGGEQTLQGLATAYEAFCLQGGEWYTDKLNHQADTVLKLLDYAVTRNPGAFVDPRRSNTEGFTRFILRDKTGKELFTIQSASSVLGETQWWKLLDVTDSLKDLAYTLTEMEAYTLKNFGTYLHQTVGGTAYAAFKQALPEKLVIPFDKAGWDAPMDDFTRGQLARECFYGGFTWLQPKDSTAYHYIDANALYAYIMRNKGVPTGLPVKTASYAQGDMGIYRVRATCDSPIIPIRVKQDLVQFVKGKSVDTYLSSPDIESILLSGGQVVVDQGFRYQKREYPFTTHIDNCEKARGEAPTKAMKKFIKKLANLVFGKTAVKLQVEERRFAANCPGEGWKPGQYITPLKPGQDDEPSSLGLRYWVRKTENQGRVFYRPDIAAFIAAEARKFMFDLVRQIGWSEVVYMDTDGLVLTQAGYDRIADMPIFDEAAYGKFKVVHANVQFKALTVKRYAIQYPGEAPDELCYTGACAGFPDEDIKDHNNFYSEMFHGVGQWFGQVPRAHGNTEATASHVPVTLPISFTRPTHTN
jgi:hypothetical protein